MNSTITNTGKFLGGYFVLNKAQRQSSFTPDDGFIVSCGKDKGLLNSILYLINTSSNYIKICSFIIDNKEIVEALKEQLRHGVVSVFILTAVDDKNIKSNLLEDNESAELSKSRHFEYINELVKLGAHVRASSNAHAKFVVKDGGKALLMSANLTEPSLSSNEKGLDPNDESGILIDSALEVKTLEHLFDSIFLYGTEFRRFVNIDDKTQLISKNENEIRLDDFPEPNSRIVWTYDLVHNLLYDKLNASIASATTAIKLSTFSIVELGNLPELIDALKLFIDKKKGSVKVFCRAMNDRIKHLASCQILAELGIEIFGDMFNHSKGISIDNREGILFTANIDGQYGLKSGFEVGYKIEDSNKVFASFNSFLDYQIQAAPYVFKLRPDKVEVFEFFKHWYSTKKKVPNWNLDSVEIKLRSSATYAKDFENGINNHPIYYMVLNRPDKKELQFEVNGKAYILEGLNENTFVVTKQLRWSDVAKGDKYIFFYSTINLTMYES